MNTCEKCKSTKNLHRHHINYDPDEIAILCETCHKQISSINTLYTKELHLYKIHYIHRKKVRRLLFHRFVQSKLDLSKKRNRKNLIRLTYVFNHRYFNKICPI